MKVLVLGASGQVGSEIRGALLAELPAARMNIEILESTRADFDVKNHMEISNYLSAILPDLIINATAYTAVDKAESEAPLAFAVNEAAVRGLAEYCAHRGAPLIHISTDYVYRGDKNDPYIEIDKVCPTGVYGLSKLAGENAIREVLNEHLIFRTSWVFGINGSNFVKTMLRVAESLDEVGVVADQVGAPTSATAIARTIAKSVGRILNSNDLEQLWGTYHFSGFPFVSWAEFACEIFDQSAKLGLIDEPPRVRSISTSDYPTPAARPSNSRLDCSKLQNTLGIRPDDWRRSLEVMLKELKLERLT